jgi:hypothetical protein
VAPVAATRASASCWVSHVVLSNHGQSINQSMHQGGTGPATSVAVLVGHECACNIMCLPRSGFVNERKRDALLRGRTGRELELAADALRELAVDARGFSRRARR